MSSSQLPRSILLALGIIACPKPRRDAAPCLSPPPPPPPPEESDDEDPTEAAPCLDYAPAEEDTGEVGPCLKMIAPEDSGDPDAGPCLEPDMGPCLEYAIPDEPGEPEGGEEEPEGAGLRRGERGGALAAARAVLERGVLPDDVAAILRDRRGRPPVVG